MLRSEYNINPNGISRDVFVSNLYIRLSENEERYTGDLVRDFCNARDGVCFLDTPKEDIDNIDTACNMQMRVYLFISFNCCFLISSILLSYVFLYVQKN